MTSYAPAPPPTAPGPARQRDYSPLNWVMPSEQADMQAKAFEENNEADFANITCDLPFDLTLTRAYDDENYNYGYDQHPAVMAGMIIFLGVIFLLPMLYSLQYASPSFGLVLLIPFALIAVGIALEVRTVRRAQVRHWSRNHETPQVIARFQLLDQLARFAGANGYGFRPSALSQAPAAIFNMQGARLTNVISGPWSGQGTRPFEISILRVPTRERYNDIVMRRWAATRDIGAVTPPRMTLAIRLGGLGGWALLDSTDISLGTGAQQRLPVAPNGAVQLDLGMYNGRCRLLATPESRALAYRIFDTNTMNALLSLGGGFDAEFTGEWLVISWNRDPMATGVAPTLAQLFAVYDAIDARRDLA